MEIANIAINVLTALFQIGKGIADEVLKFKEKNEKEEIKNKYEKMSKEFQENKDMMEKLKNELENERIRIEERKRESISRCKESLENILSQGINDIINNFNEEENDWFQCLKNGQNQNIFNYLKEETIALHNKIFESEDITKKITDKFIKASKMLLNNKELKKMNFVVIGTSGVGKSTLINQLFGEKLGDEGFGRSTTLENAKCESEKLPFFTCLDTKGTEIGSGHKLSDVLKNTIEYMKKKIVLI